jgi:hypothetical protein
MNPVRHVLIALTLSIVTFVIAGDNWNKNIRYFKPVKPVQSK